MLAFEILASRGTRCLISKPNSTPRPRTCSSCTRRPDDKTLLTLYAFYKQATVGDATGSRPTGFDIVGQAQIRRLGQAQGHDERDGDARVC